MSLRRRTLARVARGSGGLGQRREPLLLIAVAARLDHAGGHDQLGGGLDRDVELDDLAAQHIEEESVVGFGVHGMNTETYSSLLGSRAVMSAPGGVERNTSDHMPGTGNSTSPTVRKVEPDFENSVSNTCFNPR